MSNPYPDAIAYDPRILAPLEWEPMDTTDDNEEHAELGDRALDPIVIANGCDSYEALIDTLANLMHMCNRDDIDFDAALSIAAVHFAEERTN